MLVDILLFCSLLDFSHVCNGPQKAVTLWPLRACGCHWCQCPLWHNQGLISSTACLSKHFFVQQAVNSSKGRHFFSLTVWRHAIVRKTFVSFSQYRTFKKRWTTGIQTTLCCYQALQRNNKVQAGVSQSHTHTDAGLGRRSCSRTLWHAEWIELRIQPHPPGAPRESLHLLNHCRPCRITGSLSSENTVMIFV